ncbi:alpha-1,4-glucan--maltose-1-phosphate maltosyltransferase [Longivirga aurantiaca]|uniref:Alpha-1,4-glucan:maltose-1-phosphate maltosyltransferase n=1 Tax=Longivirga aurantiaca TaxID=1837743 RepID=A0ABW1SZN8_9ACTN
MPPRRRTSTGEPQKSTSPSAPDRTSTPAARPRPAAKGAQAPGKAAAPAAPAAPLRPASVGRYPVEDLDPVVALGTRPVKAVVGERLTVRATVFREGHDAVAATLVLTGADGSSAAVPMRHVGVDRWEAEVTATTEGLGHYVVEAWGDPVETWRHRAEVKVPAGLDVELELEEGARVLETAMAGLPRGKVRDPLKAAVHALRDAERPGPARLAVALDPTVTALLEAYPLREHVTPSTQVPVLVERERALFGSWYEFFPRSEGATLDPVRSGTFRTAAERLPAVAAMGFDVLYLPPIHPVGFTNRKGRNNTLDPGPDDPGVPWGIGSAAGGHDAIHPDLGTIDDFRYFVGRAAELGIEIALDFALQCSPDHPWVTEHPNWFAHRADGTIAYAENPPKKYQDIYPVYFDDDFDGILAECDRILRHWMAEGVRIFRVDNPHTKPVHFWERLFGSINATDPDVIFLAEAFTKPAMMKLLGEVGFQQSYTYFTWRNDKWEIEEYFRELSGPLAASMRPNAFVNTPDILPTFLQYGGPPAFAIRATLAATLSPTWGVYAGFELYEHVPVAPGREEYLDSEKYEYKPRDWAAADASGVTLAPYLGQLNALRSSHPSLRRLRNLHFHHCDNDKLVVYSKREGDDVVLVVCTLDPYGVREGVLSLDLPALGLGWGDQFAARDLISGATYVWGQHPYVRLDPHVQVAHVIHVRAGAV